MTIGSVFGKVALCRGIAGADGVHWVQVRCGTQCVTALDPVGVEPGELVMLSTGPEASRLCQEIPVDAVVIGVVGENGNNG